MRGLSILGVVIGVMLVAACSDGTPVSGGEQPAGGVTRYDATDGKVVDVFCDKNGDRVYVASNHLPAISVAVVAGGCKQ